jgi:endonuclease/exonuclease/phosphatase family metal-dependent hydrolase
MPTAQLWCGDNAHKGVGVFSYTGYELALADEYDPAIQYCIPIRVHGPRAFNVIAVWIKPAPRGGYLQHLTTALERYAGFIAERPTCLIGDFNHNPCFEKFKADGGFRRALDWLAAQGIVSAYHHHAREAHGYEATPTLYLYRKHVRTFHIDYCFLPAAWAQQMEALEVGAYAEWSPLSDHSPVFVQISDREAERCPA